MTRPVFFTGTGTDIGKTHVLCALLKAFQASGQTMRVLKPVISGFDAADVEGSDTLRLMRANGDEITAEQVKATSPWRFKPALSPDMAARRERRELRIEAIASWCGDQILPGQHTVIEGAGGVMSPIAEDGLNLDLIHELDARPVLIAGAYLGTLSHTLTALRVLDRRAIVIFNEIEAGPVPLAELQTTLARFAPRVTSFAYSADNAEEIAKAVFLDETPE